MKKIWIIAADKKEMENPASLAQDKEKPRQISLEFHTCGVGLFESSYGFSNLLHSNARPDAVLLAGTAGSRDSGHIFKISLSNFFINTRFSFEEIPEFIPESWTTLPIDGLQSIPHMLNVPVYSSFGISKSFDHFSNTMNNAWENMEALSLSYICYKMKIPFAALLCCTNQICPEGRNQWKQNYKKAGEILFKTLNSLF